MREENTVFIVDDSSFIPFRRRKCTDGMLQTFFCKLCVHGICIKYSQQKSVRFPVFLCQQNCCTDLRLFCIRVLLWPYYHRRISQQHRPAFIT